VFRNRDNHDLLWSRHEGVVRPTDRRPADRRREVREGVVRLTERRPAAQRTALRERVVRLAERRPAARRMELKGIVGLTETWRDNTPLT
jgi:hypothetical protein